MKEDQQLLDSYLDGELTPDEERRLAEWLAADAEHVRQFVRETSLHRQIRETMLARPYHAYGRSQVESAKPKKWQSPIRSIAHQLGQLFVFPRSPALRGALAMTACLLLLTGLGVWCFGPTVGQPVLVEVKGLDISIERGTEFVPAANGMILQPADVLHLGTNATVSIAFGEEKTRLELSAGTELKLASYVRGKRFVLHEGRIEATVARQRPFQPMILVTPQAEARVVGTRFTLAVTTNATRLDVAEGKVKLTRTSDSAAVKVPAGHYAIAATKTELAALPLTDGILREYWTNLLGDSWIHLITYTNYPDPPDGWNYPTNLSSLEMPSNWADNYGVRIRGYLHPPETGAYTFWIAAKDDASLWLSPDEDAEKKVQIATSQGHASRDWDGRASQKSASLPLVAGKRYYFEVLHKAGVGNDHLAVAWRTPNRERKVIPMEFLSPFKTDAKERKR